MPSTIVGCQPTSGLFQAEAIPQNHLADLASPHAPGSQYALVLPGLPIFQNWGQGLVEKNFFNVNFMSTKCQGATGANTGPCVHATISLSGGRLWPNPTPKFQTRLFP